MTVEPPARHGAVAAYIAVTAAYWTFMLTDGALRMLILLHFHTLGFSPVQLAYLFLLYEFMGIVTNLSAGWVAARFGLTSTLYVGLGLQIVALAALTQLDPAWTTALSVAFVMAAQGLSGIAKDLSKMSAKSAVRILAPQEQGALFRWTATLTGSKNAVKGLGFLLGAALLALAGFEAALFGMAMVLAVILAAVMACMPAGLPGGDRKAAFREVFSRSPLVNRLSAARLFLFGARDVWFVVALPVYFYTVLSDGTPESDRAAFFLVGGFMALWIIGYGAVQVLAPKLLNAREKSVGDAIRLARFWVGVLTLIPALLAVAAAAMEGTALTALLVAVLLAFGVVFALSSSLHSYLILALSRAERVTMDVGFYYMSNAAGRLVGTLLSGLSFQAGGLVASLAVAAGMAATSWLFAGTLARRASIGGDRGSEADARN